MVFDDKAMSRRQALSLGMGTPVTAMMGQVAPEVAPEVLALANSIVDSHKLGFALSWERFAAMEANPAREAVPAYAEDVTLTKNRLHERVQNMLSPLQELIDKLKGTVPESFMIKLSDNPFGADLQIPDMTLGQLRTQLATWGTADQVVQRVAQAAAPAVENYRKLRHIVSNSDSVAFARAMLEKMVNYKPEVFATAEVAQALALPPEQRDRLLQEAFRVPGKGNEVMDLYDPELLKPQSMAEALTQVQGQPQVLKSEIPRSQFKRLIGVGGHDTIPPRMKDVLGAGRVTYDEGRELYVTDMRGTAEDIEKVGVLLGGSLEGVFKMQTNSDPEHYQGMVFALGVGPEFTGVLCFDAYAASAIAGLYAVKQMVAQKKSAIEVMEALDPGFNLKERSR